MIVYILKRVFQGFGVLLGVATIVFVILRLSGDPASLLLSPQATAEDVKIFREQFGLDRSVVYQYLAYIYNLLTGDLGRSFISHYPAFSLTMERLPYTLVLAFMTMVFVISIGVPLGVLAAKNARRWTDRLIVMLAVSGQAVPVFVTGTFLIILFAVKLHWFPSYGARGVLSLILPVATLGVYTIGRTIRLVRAGMTSCLREDYIRTARAKGVSERSILFKHSLRNVLIPVVTMLGLEAGGLFGRAVIVEVVFAWPGLGRLIVDSVLARDYAVAQAGIIMLGLTYTLINLAVDVLYRVIDPRLRFVR